MEDYYQILGVNRNASADEIKKAYRKMAMKYHPDRGGDEAMFKKVNQANDVLSDPQKRQMFDMGADPYNQNPHQNNHHNQWHFHTGGMPGGFEDLFSNFGFNFSQPRQRRPQNRTFNVSMSVTLEEAYNGVEKTIEVQYPSGGRKVVNVNVPKGIDSGNVIKYGGLGDDSIPDLPPGDLMITVIVLPHPVYRREGLNLFANIDISCFEAILGTVIEITTLDNRTLQVTIPAGTQPGTTLGLRNEGLETAANGRGKMYMVVNVVIPTNLTAEQITAVENLKLNT